MQIVQVNHYHNRPVWNTIICVVFHVRNINSVFLPLPVVPDEKLHTIFFMCDNKINWIPQLFRNKELKYFKRSWSKIRIGEKKIISNCNFLLDCTTIFYKLSSSGDSAGIWTGWILLEKHLHLSLKDLTSAVLTIPLLCLPRKLTRVYLPLSSWMGKPCYVAPLQQLLLKSPFTEIQLLSIRIRQVGWILGTILCSPKGEYGRKTECGRWRTDITNKQNKTAATCLPTCSSSNSYFM